MELKRNAEVVQQCSRWIERVFTSIAEVRTQFVEIIEPYVQQAQPIEIPAAARKQLFQAATHHLEQYASDGVGLIFQRKLMSAASPALEWWIRDGDEILRQEFVNDPGSPMFYDYEQLEWFRGGFGAEARTIAGPYIDYLGVNDYITTWTIPLTVHGRTVGVVGLDMKVNTVEKFLIPILLKAAQRRAAVVNESSQVIVSTIGPLASGTLVETVPEGYALLPLDVEDLELQLLVKTE